MRKIWYSKQYNKQGGEDRADPESIRGLFGNHADDMVEKYEYDYTINNVNTLQTLEESAKIFVDIVKNS